MQSTDHPPARAALGALLIDLGCVVSFCAIGRRTHTEGLTVGGIAETSWPFLTGTALGWLLSRGWQRPVAFAPTGLAVWACTVLVAMLLRRATSQGTAVSFIVVASVTTAVLLIGWRVAAQIISRQ